MRFSSQRQSFTRRSLLRAAGLAPALLTACDDGADPSPDARGLTDAGADAQTDCLPTVPNTEGPFYLAGAPNRSVLITPETPGTRLEITGRVLEDTACAPLNFATLEVWQANAEGQYDAQGFRLRGQLNTGKDGRFEIATIVPGRYRNGANFRPAHIHVKVSAFGHQTLTTQLYFEGDPFNGTDSFIHPSLVMRLEAGAAGVLRSRFDFVLALASNLE